MCPAVKSAGSVAWSVSEKTFFAVSLSCLSLFLKWGAPGQSPPSLMPTGSPPWGKHSRHCSITGPPNQCQHAGNNGAWLTSRGHPVHSPFQQYALFLSFFLSFGLSPPISLRSPALNKVFWGGKHNAYNACWGLLTNTQWWTWLEGEGWGLGGFIRGDSGGQYVAWEIRDKSTVENREKTLTEADVFGW